MWERVCVCVIEYMPMCMECLRASACMGCVHACARAMSARACERPCPCEGAGLRAGASAHAWVHARVLRVGECCVCARVLVCMLAYMCSGRTRVSPGGGWACTGAHVLRASTGVCARVWCQKQLNRASVKTSNYRRRLNIQPSIKPETKTESPAYKHILTDLLEPNKTGWLAGWLLADAGICVLANPVFHNNLSC